ncbi:mitochondrial carrier [Bimuria novae-zelandiae CBS 107.79]|uniref:Mitochondrial carrier n=1 Tax=Bimuria novae-zelandiae CBS 107.79 TaxID=1447943 RepID=A0A6A5V807_9PLEO|nr:mitochondrial carrier [Bimuria novae-zelandiae CBS 107.79]
MSADFWAGYLSGATGILIGNPLDLVKTRLQAGNVAPNAEPVTAAITPTVTASPQSFRQHFDRAGTLVKGTTAPLLGYGALNALLFVAYNRTLLLLHDSPTHPASLAKVWCAGAAGGFASFVVSAPTELIKCRAQVSSSDSTTSYGIARDVWRREGIRGLYYGGGITSVRDAFGYGWYFWTYEWTKQAMSEPTDTDRQAAVKVLLCGGLAGVVTWASIFPLDVVKTRVQTQLLDTPSHGEGEREVLLGRSHRKRLSTLDVARKAYHAEGPGVFFRGLGICSIRAFVVNAVQWAVYEWMMRLLRQP